MSSFNKASNRKSNILNQVKVKKHVSAVYRIMDEINALAIKLKDLNLEVTEDNVDDIVFEVTGTKLDSMEKLLLMGKLNSHVEERNI
jgi:hypothetical protein